MNDWINPLLETLSDSPWLQGALAALSTFILEDPTTIGCGLLVAEGKMAFATAFIGLASGIALGDFWLYGMGRWLGPKALSSGWISEQRFEDASRLFQRNLVWAVLVSRFLPGMRLPTYVGAGVLKASPAKFLITAIGASVTWSFLLLALVQKLGQTVLADLGAWKWLLVACLIVVWMVAARLRRPSASLHQRPPRVVSSFEFWPPVLFYAPVAFYYLWLSVRYWSLTLPTAANPSVYAGGFIGESKSQILDLLGGQQRGKLARYATYLRPLGKSGLEMSQEAERLLEARSLQLPVVAKPDQGQRGAGVKLIRSSRMLREYLEGFPRGATVLLQEWVEGPREAGILFYRIPGTQRGNVFSITLKQFPSLIGDGQQTLRELILADERAKQIAETYFRKHQGRLEAVVPEGQQVPLTVVGNHCQGTVFQNGKELLSPQLAAVMDSLFRSMPDFYFGRLDVRYRSADDLAGGNFKIIEINGAGAEATHIWDARTRLVEAYRTLFEQFRILFAIGARNRRQGCRPIGPFRLLKDFFAYQRLSKSYPQSD